jgi:hypothetical protein
MAEAFSSSSPSSQTAKIDQIMSLIHKKKPSNLDESISEDLRETFSAMTPGAWLKPNNNTSDPTGTIERDKYQFSDISSAFKPTTIPNSSNPYLNQFNQQMSAAAAVTAPVTASSLPPSNSLGSSTELLNKLNYMIHLLEETQSEKTNNVTEELVLYVFMGVFVIFIVDSFAKVGKYVR